MFQLPLKNQHRFVEFFTAWEMSVTEKYSLSIRLHKKDTACLDDLLYARKQLIKESFKCKFGMQMLISNPE